MEDKDLDILLELARNTELPLSIEEVESDIEEFGISNEPVKVPRSSNSVIITSIATVFVTTLIIVLAITTDKFDNFLNTESHTEKIIKDNSAFKNQDPEIRPVETYKKENDFTFSNENNIKYIEKYLKLPNDHTVNNRLQNEDENFGIADKVHSSNTTVVQAKLELKESFKEGHLYYIEMYISLPAYSFEIKPNYWFSVSDRAFSPMIDKGYYCDLKRYIKKEKKFDTYGMSNPEKISGFRRGKQRISGFFRADGGERYISLNGLSESIIQVSGSSRLTFCIDDLFIFEYNEAVMKGVDITELDKVSFSRTNELSNRYVLEFGRIIVHMEVSNGKNVKILAYYGNQDEE